MSGSVNKVILIGNLGADPEVRHTSSGTPVANFRMATSESWTDKGDGSKQERTEWHRIVAWGKLGENVGQYLGKGSQCYVEGALQTRKWQDREGVDRYTTEVKAFVVTFLDSKADREQRPQGNGGGQQRRPQQEQGGQDGFDYGPPPGDFDTDKVPF